MRELSTPDLFSSSAVMPPTGGLETPAREDKRSDKLAKDFIRWCFSFGSDFRNAPDIINLRTWAGKTRLKLKNREENELLVEARRVYVKRIEQMMKKSDTPILGAGEAGP